MAKCLSCGNEINDTAKFCRHCGQAVKAAAPTSEEKVCPKCLKRVPTSAKFCRYCGYSFAEENVATTAGDENVDVFKNYITWRILPGQLAVKIDEKDMSDYNNVRGLYIAPGTRALFYVNGKFVAELDSGKYKFSDMVKCESHEKKHNFVMKFLHNIATHIKNGVAKLFGRDRHLHDDKGDLFYTVVLVRGSEFPLIFTVDKATTANVRSDVGLHILCEIADLDEFFRSCLADKKFITLESYANQMLPVVKVVLNQALSNVSPQDVQNNLELADKVLSALRERFQNIYTYFAIKQIIELTATQEDLENIRILKEELYIAEQELEQAQLRNDFLNKMQNAEYDNMLRSARSKVDFEALMDKIDEDHLLNEDKKEQFILMLSAQKALREAKTEIEAQNAVNSLIQSRLLSEEEVDVLKRSIAHKADLAEVSDAHEIAMATMQNSVALDREKLQWEIEIGNKRFQNELERQRVQDNYADERRNADLDYQNRQMASKMDLLRQAQAIREEREQAQHQREMESKKLDHDAELEHYKITATMSFEQIMASNPNITPEAAAALAKKFEAEAAAAQNDKTTELVRQHSDDLKNILSQQMNLTRDVIGAQNQANVNAIAEKQRELDRVYETSEHHQDRMLAGMQTTITAAYGGVKSAPNTGNVTFCPNCGQKNDANFKFCSSCGASLQ